MRKFETAKEAIEFSESHNVITYCVDTPTNRDDLFFECDDSIAGGQDIEFWADDPESETGMLWRVHIKR